MRAAWFMLPPETLFSDITSASTLLLSSFLRAAGIIAKCAFELIKQLFRASFNNTKNTFKTVITTIIRVRNLLIPLLWVKIAHQLYFMFVLVLPHPINICQVFIIHWNNQIEIIKVVGLEATRFGMQLNSMLVCRTLAVTVG